MLTAMPGLSAGETDDISECFLFRSAHAEGRGPQRSRIAGDINDDMNDKSTVSNPTSGRLKELAGYLGIDVDDAETLIADIIPILSRKFALFSRSSHQNEPVETRIQIVLQDELPNILSNYALDGLITNKSVMLFFIKNLAPELTDLRAKQLVHSGPKRLGHRVHLRQPEGCDERTDQA